MRDFATMSGILSLLAASGVPSRAIGLTLAVLSHGLFYWLTIEPRYNYTCKCTEDMAIFDVSPSQSPETPRVAWRGDTTVTPPQPFVSSATQARSILSEISDPDPFSIRFIVGTNVRVRECNIGGQVQTTGDASPKWICNRIKALRFRPAMDRQGRPVDYVLP